MRLRRLAAMATDAEVGTLTDAGMEVTRKMMDEYNGATGQLERVSKLEIKLVLPVLNDLILRCVSTIARLEQTRMHLKVQARLLDGGDNTEALEEMKRQRTFLTPDELGPANPVL